MMFKTQILDLLNKINSLDKTLDNSMCGNVYYLNNDEIVCMERDYGESRFPYTETGLVLWAYSNGYMHANEHNLKIFHTARAHEEPCIDFFSGIKNDDETYTPISITGAAKQLFEPDSIERYVVFSRECAIYITKTNDAVFALRAYVSSERNIHFSLSAINTSDKEIDIYLSSYIEPLMVYTNEPGYWDKMAIKGKYLGDRSYVIDHNAYVSRNMATLNEKVTEKQPLDEQHSIARMSFTGGYGRSLHNATSLKYGTFKKSYNAVTRIDFPAFSDIYKFQLKKSESTRIDYRFEYFINASGSSDYKINQIDTAFIDNDILDKKKKYENVLSGLSINFGKLHDSKMSNELLNKFLKTVQYSVNFCATNDEYGGRFLGMRDVFQQMEVALAWNPEGVREKIVRWFNYFFDTGRTPRSVAIEMNELMKPTFICEEYIDQGLWVISCVYSYLCYTDDYSVLDEICGFYHLNDAETQWHKSDEKSSVLDHMLRIMDYFINNLDTKCKTNCLRALMGDWNDSINGLGVSNDKDERFGSGVTVMGSLQLYENFSQMIEILSHLEGYDEYLKKYKAYQKKLEEGLLKYAVDVCGEEKQIIHGWGDKLSYKVASFCDEDGNRRHGLITNAFWIISGLIRKSPELKSAIMNSYNNLNSKYGFITFNPGFTPDMTGVGRMRFILPGNAENACAYVHASMFANMSLFGIGESKMAWKQLEKSIPISHDYINTSPYVMSNQYCDNDEYQTNGEAISDWATGSNPTLIKSILKYGFGIAPNLDYLCVAPAKFMPSDEAELTFTLNNFKITVKYKNNNTSSRKFTVNGNITESQYDKLSDTEFIKIAKKDITSDITIHIED